MMITTRQRKFVSLLLLALTLEGCVYSPLSRKVSKWAGESFGRKTLDERFFSGLVVLATIPVVMCTAVVDLPLGILEFFFGFAPFTDPLIKTSMLDYKEHQLPGEKPGETWIVRRLVEEPSSFHVRRLQNGTIEESLLVTPLADGNLRLSKLLEPAPAEETRELDL